MSGAGRGRPSKAKIPADLPKTPIITGGTIPKSIPVRPTPAETAQAESAPTESEPAAAPAETVQAVSEPAETVTEAESVEGETEPVAAAEAEAKAETPVQAPAESPAEVKEAPEAEPAVDDVKAELSEFLGKVKLLSSRNKDEMPAVCRISRGGRFYYLTVPQLPNSAITDCWAIARGRMTGEECVAYIVSALGISPPRLYSKYESIELD